MSNLLSDLSSGKTPYQNYIVEHGIERLDISIPLQHVAVFEAAFKAAEGNKQKILKAVSDVSGKVK